MTSKDKRLNELLAFSRAYNSLSRSKKISQLAVLKAYIKMCKSEKPM